MNSITWHFEHETITELKICKRKRCDFVRSQRLTLTQLQLNDSKQHLVGKNTRHQLKINRSAINVSVCIEHWARIQFIQLSILRCWNHQTLHYRLCAGVRENTKDSNTGMAQVFCVCREPIAMSINARSDRCSIRTRNWKTAGEVYGKHSRSSAR